VAKTTLSSEVASFPQLQRLAMGTRVRVFRHSTLLLFFMAGPLVPTLAAGTVTVDFSGTIASVFNPGNTEVAVGDSISGSFAYSTAQSGSGGLYTFTGSPLVHSFSFTVSDSGGNQLFTDYYTGNFTAYYAISVIYGYTSNPLYPGVNGTELNITGDTLYMQGHGISPGFDLTYFNPGNIGTSPSNPLPDSTVIKNFVSNKAFLVWGDPGVQSFTADFGFQSVPEPSSLLLAILGLSTCTIGFSAMRRKSAGDSRSRRSSAA
jgi:hypothetical protein